jgi:hypothetical protein
MKLIDLVTRLDALDVEATIYVGQPWSADSAAIADVEPAAGGAPESALREGLVYFIEVAVARDFLEDWVSSLDSVPSPLERCIRLIRYAMDDA